GGNAQVPASGFVVLVQFQGALVVAERIAPLAAVLVDQADVVVDAGVVEVQLERSQVLRQREVVVVGVLGFIQQFIDRGHSKSPAHKNRGRATRAARPRVLPSRRQAWPFSPLLIANSSSGDRMSWFLP